jgi:hypothetical protein
MVWFLAASICARLGFAVPDASGAGAGSDVGAGDGVGDAVGVDVGVVGAAVGSETGVDTDVGGGAWSVAAWAGAAAPTNAIASAPARMAPNLLVTRPG